MHFLSSHPAFNDTIDSLRNELKTDTSNHLVICGAHDISKYESINKYKDKYDKVIIFNQEPLTATQRQFMHLNYFKWLKQADEVWDYDEQNITNVLKFIRPDVQLHTLKPYKNWNVYAPHKKDIDILFYGSLNTHRLSLLTELKQRYNIVFLTNEWKRLDEYILRSKILLNIHYYYESAMQEQARMIRWIGAPCRLISEKSTTNYLGVEELDYKELFSL